MSYNGIGLTTPRGSGTNGYVQRNLSHLRPREDYRSRDDFKAEVRHRQPDAGILDHERKRKVEVACMELQVKLEDEEIPEEEIAAQVAALRAKLSTATTIASGRVSIRPEATHELAAAKEAELDRMSRALGINKNSHKEGQAFDRDYQAEKAAQKREEFEQRREQQSQMKLQALERMKAREEMAKLQAEKRAAEERANRAEAELQASRRRRSSTRSPTPPRRRYSRSPDARQPSNRNRSFSPPPRNRRRDYSASPPPRRRSRSRSRSPPRRRRADSRDRSRSGSVSRSPPRQRRRFDPSPERERQRSPPARSRRDESRSRSPPPKKRRESFTSSMSESD